MRRRVDPSRHVVRAQGSLHLALHEPPAVADPRCSPPAAARVLSALARQPLANAEALAGRPGITVRGVQMALRQLAGDGLWVVHRAGRHVEYQLADSAFREPTGKDLGAVRDPAG
jgi:DNA-binding transcriptional ArsR family regulator